MSTNQIPTRVRFYNGQYLQAGDLDDEQTYHVQMRWRHNLALHSWGIVAGLDARVAGTDIKHQQLTVGSGMAIDGYGRELVLTSDYPVPLNDHNPNAVLDIWIYYQLVKQAVPAGGCPGPKLAAGQSDPRADRQAEDPLIELKITSASQSSDPSRPDEVPIGDLDFSPQNPLPSDAEQKWPVFLGRLSFRENEGWSVDGSLRRPAGLVAGQVRSPANDAGARTVVVNGPQPDLDPFAFAVFTNVHENSNDPTEPGLGDVAPAVAVTAPIMEDESPRIELTADRVRVAADMTFKDGAALEFVPNLIKGADHFTIPRGAENWRIYHHFEPPPRTAIDGTAVGGFSDELRVTMPEGKDGENRVVIGSFSDKGIFTPVLAVLDNQRVEIYGSLQVESVLFGSLSDAPAGQSGAQGGDSAQKVVDFVTAKLKSHVLKPEDLIGGLAAASDGGGSLWQSMANSIGTSDPTKVIDPVTVELWKSDRGLKSLGANVSNSAANLKKFLDHIPDVPNPPQTEAFGIWAFHDGQKRATPLVDGMPTDSNNSALKDFAAKLVEAGNNNKLKALLQALIDATGSDGTNGVDSVAAALKGLTPKADFDGLMAKVIDHVDPKAMADELARRKENEKVAEAFLGSVGAGLKDNDDFLTAVGTRLPTTVAHVTPLLAGSPDQLRTLAKALFDKSGDAGKAAVADALKEGIKIPPPTPDNTRIRVFLRYVKTDDGLVHTPPPAAQGLHKNRAALD